MRLPDHNLPSDYSDVQPSSYDPEYISDISSKMQVPHRLGVGAESDYSNGGFGMNGAPQNLQYQYTGMSVPDKIIVAGGNQHIGGQRQELYMDTPSAQMSTESLSYVGLMTPPHTLTLEERFPHIEDIDEAKQYDKSANSAMVVRQASVGNGEIAGPVPYAPGVNHHDPLLLNEENEASLLRTQVSKLTRRVQVIEQDNGKRAQRELVLYPVIIGYFFWKVLGWLTKDQRY